MAANTTTRGSANFARWLLATSSLVAFSAAISVGTPTPAHAINPCSVINSGTSTGLSVSNTIVNGNVCNTGTLTPGGITVTNSTINGEILNSGPNAGGISVDKNSQVNNPSNLGQFGLDCAAAIAVAGNGTTTTNFSGGISNAGTLNVGSAVPTQIGCIDGFPVSAAGIGVTHLSSFAGGINNTGNINVNFSVVPIEIPAPGVCANANAQAAGIGVQLVSNFSGGITHSGVMNVNTTAAVTNLSCGHACAVATGIGVNNVSTFTGGISVLKGGVINAVASATVTAFGLFSCVSAQSTAYGIAVNDVSSFGGGITNNGVLSATATTTISATAFESCAKACAGSANAYGIYVGNVSLFTGNITNGGSIAATATMTSTATGVQACNGAGATANAYGIYVHDVSTFTGNIINNGSISATATASGTMMAPNGVGSFSFSSMCSHGVSVNVFSKAYGIGVDSVSTFNGGITNNNSISAAANATANLTSTGALNQACAAANAYGISVNHVVSFSGGIVNNGGVTAAATATASTSLFEATGCNCTRAIANAYGISVTGVSFFSGGIKNNGSITATASATASLLTCSNSSDALASASATAYGITVSGPSTFSGGITNSGGITASATASISTGLAKLGQAGCNNVFANATAYGINVSSVSTFSGGITNNGSVTAIATATATAGCGKAVANASAYGINVDFVPFFAGGITNNGTLTATATASSTAVFGCEALANAHAYGINASEGIVFGGGITNNAAITASASASAGLIPGPGAGGCACAFGINVDGFALFLDGITNSLHGTITASATGYGLTCASAYGINVTNMSSFSGGIKNNGIMTVSAVTSFARACAYGINVSHVSTFIGGITNNGTLTVTATNLSCGKAVAYGIRVDSVSSFGGGITNNGKIVVTANTDCVNAITYGISVNKVSSFSGDINNQGLIQLNTYGVGIYVNNVSTFNGQIINGGTINAAIGILIGANTPGISIFNNGTIDSSGCASALAIDFKNLGSNTLTLGPGFSITGNVVAENGANTFQLGGVGNGTFDISTIGPAAQYQGFSTFNTISATWTVTGTALASTNSWNVTGGTMLVNGDMSPWTGGIFVNADTGGGTLGGTGTIFSATIENGGTLMPGLPGTPGGTLTINNNLEMQSGSTYLVNVAPGTTTFGTASSTTVTGTATIDSGALLAVSGSGAFTQGVEYKVLAAGTETGTFSNTNNVALGHLGSMLANIEYGGTGSCPTNDVCLALTPANLFAFLPSGLSVNQTNVVNGINGANTGTPPVAFQNLFNLSPSQLANALTQLSGEVATGTQESSIQLMNQFMSLLSPSSLTTLGSGMGSAPGFAPEESLFTPEIANAYAGAIPTKAPMLVAQPRYNIWGAGYGGSNSVTGDPSGLGSHDTRGNAAGTAAGIDYRPDPASVFGVALGGATTNWNVSDSLGKGRTDAFQAGIYGSRQYGPAYLSGVASFANFWATTDRTINVMGTDQYHASFNAQSFGGRLEGGYHVATVPLGVTPYAAVQAQYFHLPSYTETVVSGSGAFLDSFAEKNQTVVRTELGSWFDRVIPSNDMSQLKLFARAAWAHDFNNEPSLTATFVGLPTASFVVNGAKPAPDLALATAGAEYKTRSGLSFSGRFDGEFGKGTETVTGTGVVKYQW